MRRIVITGVSSGIGKAAAEALRQQGFFIYGSVRNAADAASFEAEFGPHARALVFDVTDLPAMQAAAAQVRADLDGQTLAGLVNNAGIALPGPALLQPLEEFARVIDVNLMGVVRACQVFAPMLGLEPDAAGPKGRIVNISSVSGRFGYPFTAAYAASKHAVEGFSDSLRRELLIAGIDVIVIGPGAVRTPIWAKGGAVDFTRYAGSIWAKALARSNEYLARMDATGLPPQTIGALVVTALTHPRPKARYAPVPGKLFNWYLPRLLPARVVDRLAGKRLGLLD